MTTTTTATTTNPVTMTPREIDLILAPNWTREQIRSIHLRSLLDYQERQLAGDRRCSIDYAESIARLRAEIAVLRAEAEPLEAEYARRPWRRYFLVTNGNGHVHRGMACATCFATTQYRWLPELSGCEESAMVAEYGEQACTVCFPDAPSLYQQLKASGQLPRIEQERRAARQARDDKRAAAAAKKAANAITADHGGVLRGPGHHGRFGSVIETVPAAKSALLEALRYADPAGAYYRADMAPEYLAEERAAADRIIDALAAKLNRPAEDIREEYLRKARKIAR